MFIGLMIVLGLGAIDRSIVALALVIIFFLPELPLRATHAPADPSRPPS